MSSLLFEKAFESNQLQEMENNYSRSGRNNYYLDISLEEGNVRMVDFFLHKGYQPSLYAIQMSRMNGHHSLANRIESYYDLRNKTCIKSVLCKYDRKSKSLDWDPIVPLSHRY